MTKINLVEHNGLYYWVGATDARHEGTWLWGSGAAVDDFVWMESKKYFKCINCSIYHFYQFQISQATQCSR